MLIIFRIVFFKSYDFTAKNKNNFSFANKFISKNTLTRSLSLGDIDLHLTVDRIGTHLELGVVYYGD